MQATHSRIQQLFSTIQFSYVATTTIVLLTSSVLLSYIFQEIVFHNHCITKLGIILSGNMIYWAAANPLINLFSDRKAAGKAFIPASLALGAGLLFINQVVIEKAIYFVFLYGFGCLEGVSNAAYMLFENNILTSGLIYSMLILVSYHRAVEKIKLRGDSSPITTETAAIDIPVYKSSFVIKNNGSKLEVKVGDIRYIEASRNTIFIFAGNKKHVLYQSMVSVERELDPAQFIKIHRAFIVNKSFVSACAGMGNGNILLKLTCGTELTMTRHYKTQVAAFHPVSCISS